MEKLIKKHTRSELFSNTGWNNVSVDHKAQLLDIVTKLDPLAIYLRGSWAKGLEVGPRTTLTGEERLGSDQDITVIVKPMFRLSHVQQKYLGEIKSKNSDYVFKSSDKLWSELIEDQNYDAVESLFFDDSCYIYEHDLFKELRKLRSEFLTKKFCYSAAGNANNQYEAFAKENSVLQFDPEEFREVPDLLDFVYIRHNGLYANTYVPIKTFLSEFKLDVMKCKYSAINFSVDSLGEFIKDYNTKIAKLNQQLSDARRALLKAAETDEEVDAVTIERKGLALINSDEFRMLINSVDTIGDLHYNFAEDASFTEKPSEGYEKFRKIISSNPYGRPIWEDFLKLIQTPNVEKNKWGLVSQSTRDTAMVRKDSASTEDVEQFYPIGTIVYRTAEYTDYLVKYCRYHKWVGDLYERTGWTEPKHELQVRNEERHSVNMAAARLAGYEEGNVKVYDTKRFQQCFYISRVTSEMMKNVIAGQKPHLQVNRKGIDRDELLKLKFQDEYPDGYISKEKCTEMLLKNKMELAELIKVVPLPWKLTEDTIEKVTRVFELINLSSVPQNYLEALSSYDIRESDLDSESYVNILNKFIEEF